MEKIRQVHSKVIPLPLNDVDTDMIIPAQYLTSISREGFGDKLFKRLREDDPEFPFNQEKYRGAKILVGANNFGCGSSREHAVWALMGAGIRVVIAKSFADIFSGNSAKNGLLLVKLPPEKVDELLKDAQSGTYELTVDLEKQAVLTPAGESAAFDFDPFRRHCLLNGLDDIDYINENQETIARYRQRCEELRFYSTLTPNRETWRT